MIMTLAGEPKTTIICCYSPKNTPDNFEEVTRFYNDLATVASVPAHNCLIISGDFNAKLGPGPRNFSSRSTKDSIKNGRRLIDFFDPFHLFAGNTKFQSRPGKLWTHRYPNGYLAQLNYVLDRKKVAK